jgi:N-acetylglucosaminyl-diphospho-decaprenol L-rhamnosyltransferase
MARVRCRQHGNPRNVACGRRGSKSKEAVIDPNINSDLSAEAERDMGCLSRRATVVIVAYNSKSTIEPALTELAGSDDQAPIEVIVVDNNSSDGIVEFLQESYPWVSVIPMGRNLGFGSACNRGIQASTRDYVLLLNPDAVLGRADLRVMVDFMDSHARAGLCGPAVVEASGRLQPTGGMPNPWTVMMKPFLPSLVSRGRRHVSPGDAPERTDWICGSIMLIRREMINDIGAFDPRFFLYFEETDLCRRAQRAGWELWTDGRAVGTHINASSAQSTKAHMMWGVITKHYFESRFYYLTKHFGLIAAVTAEIGEVVSMVLRTMRDRLRGRSYGDLTGRRRGPFFKRPSNSEDR